MENRKNRIARFFKRQKNNKPSLRQRSLTLEHLESREMLSNTGNLLASAVNTSAYSADLVNDVDPPVAVAASFAAPLSTSANANQLATPTINSAKWIAGTVVTVGWNYVPYALNYKLEYAVSGTDNWTSVTAYGTVWTSTSLSKGTDYDFRVTALANPYLPYTNSDTSAVYTLSAQSATKLATPTISSGKWIANSVLTVNWNVVPYALNYKLEYAVSGTNNWTSVTVYGPAWTTTSLAKGTDYDFRVTALANPYLPYSNSDTSTVYTVKAQSTTKLAAPTISSGKWIANSVLMVNWNTIPGALNYKLEYAVSGTNNWTSVTVYGPAWTTTSLAKGTDYDFRVTAIANPYLAYADSDASAVYTVKAQAATKLATPTITSGQWISGTVLSVGWNTIPYAQSYKLEYAVSGTDNWTSVTVYGPVWTTASLAKGTDYDFRVTAIANPYLAYSDSDTSAVYTVKAQSTTKLATPVINAARTKWITSSILTVGWDYVPYALNYKLEYAVSGTNNWSSVTAYGVAWTLTGLQKNTNYDVRVTAIANPYLAYSDSDASAVYTAVQAAVKLASPEGVGATRFSGGCSVYWNPVSNAANYKVEYAQNGSSSWTSVTVSECSAVLSGLDDELAYNVRVTALAASGSQYTNSDPSASILVDPFSTQLAVPELTQAILSAGTLVVNWNEVANAAGYQVKYRADGLEDWTEESSSDVSWYATGLTEGISYEVCVKAVAEPESEYTDSDFCDIQVVSPTTEE